MQNNESFKLFLNLPQAAKNPEKVIQEHYQTEVEDFLKQYNAEHPDEKIWIHGFYSKETLWFINGETVSVRTKLTRFVFIDGINKGKTFTFMGSMFVSGSRFSTQFILSTMDKNEKSRIAKAETSQRTLNKWRKSFNAFFGPLVQFFLFLVPCTVTVMDRTLFKDLIFSTPGVYLL